MLVVDERVVPPKDVVALEETLLEVLALDRTVALLAAVEDGERAEVEATLEAADVVLTLLDASAEVVEAGAETPAVEEGDKSALPGEAATPDPAPDDDPAVVDAVAADELLVEEDWM